MNQSSGKSPLISGPFSGTERGKRAVKGICGMRPSTTWRPSPSSGILSSFPRRNVKSSTVMHVSSLTPVTAPQAKSQLLYAFVVPTASVLSVCLQPWRDLAVSCNVLIHGHTVETQHGHAECLRSLSLDCPFCFHSFFCLLTPILSFSQLPFSLSHTPLLPSLTSLLIICIGGYSL